MICKDEVLFVFFSARAERSGASESGASEKTQRKQMSGHNVDELIILVSITNVKRCREKKCKNEASVRRQLLASGVFE